MPDEKVVQIEKAIQGDIFDNLDQLRVGQNFDEKIGVKKQITTVPVRKPNKQEFIKVHRSPEYRLDTIILELKSERENYIIDPALLGELPDEVVPKMLYFYITRRGDIALWPVRLPDTFGRLDSWNQSAHKAAEFAMENWTRVVPNLNAGYYDTLTPINKLSEPEWPDISFDKVLRLGFGDYFVDSIDHPVLRRLRGVE